MSAFWKRLLLILLWAIIGLILIGLFVWQRQDTRIELQLSQTALEDARLTAETARQEGVGKNATTTLTNAEFTGRDSRNRLWHLAAQKARKLQKLEDDVLELERVRATLRRPNETEVNLQSTQGTYNTDAETLLLQGNVMVFGYGLTMQTPQLDVDLAARRLESGQPVSIEGPWARWYGTIQAGRLVLREPGPKLRLTGGVRARFVPLEEN